jgi:antitoxin (DNA-binding transcriptional repressor) of toxin-antitoxin stability system
MTALTMKSEEARNSWRNMLDHTFTGGEVVIERHGKPTAVMVNYQQWQAWKSLLTRLTKTRYEEMKSDPSQLVTEEQYQQALQTEGLTT